jgi:Glucodextranase, domain B
LRYPFGSILLGLALALATTLIALAQADDDAAPPTDDAVDTTVIAPAADQTPPTLFLQLTEPVEQDVEVALSTEELTVRGVTLAGAIVSIDGDLVDVDDQGGFVGVTPLDEGANEIEVVASDDQGNQVSTTLFVVRGD